MEQKKSRTLVIDSSKDVKVLKALSSEVRVRILELLQNQELNVTEIARRLAIPQSTATTSILMLEEAGLIDSHTANGVKGGLALCPGWITPGRYSGKDTSPNGGTGICAAC